MIQDRTSRGISSIGRALRRQRKGNEFESRILHFYAAIVQLAEYNPGTIVVMGSTPIRSLPKLCNQYNLQYAHVAKWHTRSA